MDPEGGCAQLTKFDGVTSVEAVDDLTVKVTFDQPTPFPYGPFVGGESPIIQAAQFADCMGAKAPECTEANFNPIGTGPFVVDEFKPNDVITMSANPNFRDPDKPAFATLTFKGGGDATAAGRAVMETGEFDYAWNLQLGPRCDPAHGRRRQGHAGCRFWPAGRADHGQQHQPRSGAWPG